MSILAVKEEIKQKDFANKIPVGASQEEFNKLHSEWIHKNVYAGCVFIFHEMGIVKKDFTHKIIR